MGFDGREIGDVHGKEVRLHRRLTSEVSVKQLERMEQLKRSRSMAQFVCTCRECPTSSMLTFDLVPAAFVTAETVDAVAEASVL